MYAHKGDNSLSPVYIGHLRPRAPYRTNNHGLVRTATMRTTACLFSMLAMAGSQAQAIEFPLTLDPTGETYLLDVSIGPADVPLRCVVDTGSSNIALRAIPSELSPGSAKCFPSTSKRGCTAARADPIAVTYAGGAGWTATVSTCTFGLHSLSERASGCPVRTAGQKLDYCAWVPPPV
jgi:hypothetical protein